MDDKQRVELRGVLDGYETIEELVEANEEVISYIRERQRVEAAKESVKYSPGDKVKWTSKKRFKAIEGTVKRVNQKTLSVDAGDQGQWRVPYSMVEKVE